MGLAPYFTKEPSWRASCLESLDRVLRRLVDEVPEQQRASVQHCVDMLEEAYPDPAERQS